MPLPASTPRRRVIIRSGAWSDGSPTTTSVVRFTPVPEVLRDVTAKSLIPTRQQTAKLVAGQAQTTVDLVCTDGVQPAAWTWRVDTPWSPPQHILVPKGPTGNPEADPPLHLADLLPVPASNGVGVIRGQAGWSPSLSILTLNGRTLLQVADWFGGEGEKPAVGYVGPNGVTSNPLAATDLKAAASGSPDLYTPGTDVWLLAWANPDALISGAITRDANGALVSAQATWPDGSPGVFTGTPASTPIGALSGWQVTYVPVSGPAKRVRQPNVTWGPAGVSAVPPRVVEVI